MASIDFSKEQKRETLIRDVRTPTQRFKDSLNTYHYPFIWTSLCALGVGFSITPISEALLLAGGAICFKAIKKQRQSGLPCSYPTSARKKDPNTVDAGTPMKKWKNGLGIFYCGNDRHTGKQLWIDSEQFRRHSFFMGTTGSGKTEFLLSVMLNSLIQGSSYIFIDGKGDIKLYFSAYSQARALGREHDILLLNFLTGEKDILGAQDSKISNSFNYYGAGNSDSASQTTISIIDGENDIWGKRAASFIESLMKPLVFLRNEYKVDLDVEKIRYYFSIHELERLLLIAPMDYKGLSATLSGLKNYFVNLPDWSIRRSTVYDEFLARLTAPENDAYFKRFKRDNPDFWELIKADVDALEKQAVEASSVTNNQQTKKEDNKGQGQASETMLQHGYITMQLVQVFNSLADTYGYIMRTSCPDIDMRDVILHRRILIALLPALAKSPAELKNLGRIILAVIKNAMVTGLGYQAEGDVLKTIENRPTNSPTPIPIVADECGTYLIDGAFVLPAQGRSLGVGMVFAAQDITALLKNLDQETYSILGNTVNKFCGKLDDKESAEYFEKLAGEGKFATLSGFESNDESGTTFKRSRNVGVEAILRVSFNDLRGHTAGHWHYFFGNRIFYIRSFYANTETVSFLRVNHFIEIPNIGAEESSSLQRIVMNLNEVMTKRIESGTTLSKYIDKYLNKDLEEIEAELEITEKTPKSVYPKDLALTSLILGQNILNYGFNASYIDNLTNILNKDDEDITERDLGKIPYSPMAYPFDLNRGQLKDMLAFFQQSYNTTLKHVSLNFGENNKNELQKSEHSSFENHCRAIILSAGISGKQFLAIKDLELNRQSSATNYTHSKDAVFTSLTQYNNLADQNVQQLEELTLQESDNTSVNLNKRINDVVKAEAMLHQTNIENILSNYSLYDNNDDATKEKILTTFEELRKLIEESASEISGLSFE